MGIFALSLAMAYVTADLDLEHINHSEHRDFRLRLTRVSDGGAAEWRRLLTAHFEGCPAR